MGTTGLTIALAITIFGGWNPLRAAFGAYLFALLQWLGVVLQPSLPNIPSQVLQVAPFPLMILTLLLVNIGHRMGRCTWPPAQAPAARRLLRFCAPLPRPHWGTVEREKIGGSDMRYRSRIPWLSMLAGWQ
jgi:hypothetical protein